LRRAGDPLAAVESYERALELDPKYAWAWNGLGLAYVALNRWSDALSAYEQAVHLNPDDVWFWHNLGDAWMMLDHDERAVDAFERALEIDPAHEQTRRKLQQARDRLDTED
jgi:superkiller protein 3